MKSKHPTEMLIEFMASMPNTLWLDSTHQMVKTIAEDPKMSDKDLNIFVEMCIMKKAQAIAEEKISQDPYLSEQQKRVKEILDEDKKSEEDNLIQEVRNIMSKHNENEEH